MSRTITITPGTENGHPKQVVVDGVLYTSTTTNVIISDHAYNGLNQSLIGGVITDGGATPN